MRHARLVKTDSVIKVTGRYVRIVARQFSDTHARFRLPGDQYVTHPIDADVDVMTWRELADEAKRFVASAIANNPRFADRFEVETIDITINRSAMELHLNDGTTIRLELTRLIKEDKGAWSASGD